MQIDAVFIGIYAVKLIATTLSLTPIYGIAYLIRQLPR